MARLPRMGNSPNKPSDRHVELGTMTSPADGRDGDASLSVEFYARGSISILVSEIEPVDEVKSDDPDRCKSRWELRLSRGRNRDVKALLTGTSGKLEVKRQDFEPGWTGPNQALTWLPSREPNVYLQTSNGEVSCIRKALISLCKQDFVNHLLNPAEIGSLQDMIGHLEAPHRGR